VLCFKVPSHVGCQNAAKVAEVALDDLRRMTALYVLAQVLARVGLDALLAHWAHTLNDGVLLALADC
jgi:hypothetical protein